MNIIFIYYTHAFVLYFGFEEMQFGHEKEENNGSKSTLDGRYA